MKICVLARSRSNIYEERAEQAGRRVVQPARLTSSLMRKFIPPPLLRDTFTAALRGGLDGGSFEGECREGCSLEEKNLEGGSLSKEAASKEASSKARQI